MSFNLNWNTLETDSLRLWTEQLLTGALNSGKRPNILASDITIKDLNFGKVAPTFEVLEIGELDKDRFRGIFKITYAGDFHLTLHTKVQANPLKIYSDNSREMEIDPDSPFVTPHFSLSTDPFNIPLDLKLSDIKISGIGIIVFSKTKGLTLVFRNDPLDSIKVSSSFDAVQVLSNFLQKQIEHQIRDLFRETLPTLIHKLSLKYTSSFQNNDFMNNLRDHLKDQLPVNSAESLELESISPNNLKKLAKLYSSRETLELRIPKLKKTVQRSYLERYNKNYLPTLANSLYSTLDMTPVPGSIQGNSIPVDVLLDSNFKNVDKVLQEISNIQTKSFKSGTSEAKRPKRRTYKLGRKDKSVVEEKSLTSSPSTPRKQASLAWAGPLSEKRENDADASSELSDTSTVLDEQASIIHHPTPVKVRGQKAPALHQMVDLRSDLFPNVCPSPLNSSSSFVGSVGLGNSYFNLAPGHAISTSPLRPEKSRSASQEEITLKVKKSMNSVNIDQIHEKLQLQMKLDEAAKLHEASKYSEASKHQEASKFPEAFGKRSAEPSFEMPPPPYYHAPRAGF